MNKNEIEEFLSAHPSEAKKQKAWGQHLKDVGYKNGMLICACGCYGFGWGKAPEDGLWYLPGHEPRSVSVQEKQTRKSRKNEPRAITLEDIFWLFIAMLAVVLLIAVLLPYLGGV